MGALRPKVVFDCNVLLQAVARTTSPAAQCLRLVEQGTVTLFLSKPVLREVSTVLNDAIVKAQNLALTPEIVDAFIRKITFRSQLVRDVPHTFNFPRDPKDEKYIDLVAACDAEFLVTRDKDFLDLAHSDETFSKEFRQRFHRLSILTPDRFLLTVSNQP